MALRRTCIASCALAIAACSSADAIKHVPGRISLAPTSIEFGSVEAGARVVQSFTISNVGGELVRVTSVDVSGDARHAFSLSMTPASVAVGASAQMSIAYAAPLQEGSDVATVSVASSAENTMSVKLSIHARSVPRAVPDGGVSDAAPSADARDAGAAAVNADATTGGDALPRTDGQPGTDASPDASPSSDAEAGVAPDAAPDAALGDATFPDALPPQDGGGAVTAFVAWEDSAAGGQHIYLRRWNGTLWEELGGSASGTGLSATAGSSAIPVVALEPSGNPVVAWTEQPSGGQAQIYVRRWNGSAWEELGGSGSGLGISNAPPTSLSATYPSIAVDHQGRITVAWQFADLVGGACCNIQIYLKRWNGMVWEELGGSASAGGISGGGGSGEGSHPALTVDRSDRPIVAWNHEASSNCDIYLRRWNGAAWEELGGSASGGGLSLTNSVADPEITLGLDDNPIVAWPTGDGRGGFMARRWIGDRWLDVGPRVSSTSCTAGLYYPVTADSADQAVVAAFNPGGTGPIRISRGVGASWQPIASPGMGDGQTSIASDESGGLLVAYVHYNGSQVDIYLQRWNGSAWQELGGSASGGGLSNTVPGYSGAPSIASIGP